MVKRISTHKIETYSKDFIRTKVNSFYETGDALYRDLTERDYGIDGLIELFDKGVPTGKIALLQIKGTEKEIKKLKRTPDFISCQISNSNAYYAFQNNIPVILIYVNVISKTEFFFLDLNKKISEDKLKQDRITIQIPVNNCVTTMERVFEIINSFYTK